MEEKKVEEILQDEEIPVTEEASGEGDVPFRHRMILRREQQNPIQRPMRPVLKKHKRTILKRVRMKIILTAGRKAFSVRGKRRTRKRLLCRKRLQALRTA